MAKVTREELTLGLLENSYQIHMIRPNAKRNWTTLCEHLSRHNMLQAPTSVGKGDVQVPGTTVEIVPRFRYEGKLLDVYVKLVRYTETPRRSDFSAYEIEMSFDRSVLKSRQESVAFISMGPDYDPAHTVLTQIRWPDTNARFTRILHKALAVLPSQVIEQAVVEKETATE